MSIKLLDRELQRNILSTLGEHYPASFNILPKEPGDTQSKYIVNLAYLEEHGLIEAGLRQFADALYYSTGSRITKDGIDFVADDGGLSAILDVVTIKFHEADLRALIESRVAGSDLPPADKNRLIDQLRELRGESIKHLTMTLLDKGMENWPAALLAIQMYLQNAPK